MQNKKLSHPIYQEIIHVVLTYKKPEKIVIFGSRATDCFEETSDIDIAIFGRQWTDRDINIVKNSLEETIKTPLKFDIVNFYSLTKEQLKNNILEEGGVIYDAETD